MSIDFYFEMLSLIIAIFSYKALKQTKMVYFIPFLLLTVIVEFIGYLAIIYAIKNKNYWLYNLLIYIKKTTVNGSLLYVKYYIYNRQCCTYYVPYVVYYILYIKYNKSRIK